MESGIKELKNNLSKYLSEATEIVTSSVAQMVILEPLPERVDI